MKNNIEEIKDNKLANLIFEIYNYEISVNSIYKNIKGSIADVSNIIRVGVTSLSQTPDLYIILKLLGKDRIKNRLDMLK